MTDDLEDLKQAMNAATPRPDPARRAENIALAQKNFVDLQGSRDERRLTSDRPKTGLMSGVKHMLNTLTSRAALTATTAVVAVGLVMLSPLGDAIMPKNQDIPFAPAVLTDQPETQARKTASPAAPAPVIVEEAAPMAELGLAADSMAPESRMMAEPATSYLVPEPPMFRPETDTETFANAERFAADPSPNPIERAV